MSTTLAARAQAPQATGRRSAPTLLLPIGVGVGLLVVLTAAVLLVQALLGRAPFGPNGRLEAFQSILVHIAVVAYLPAAYLALVARARERLREVGGGAGSQGGGIVLLPGTWSVWAWTGAALLGATLGILGPYLTEPYQHTLFEFWSPRAWSPEVWWHRTLGVVAGIGLGGFCFALVRSSLDFSRAALELPIIDIFDLRPLRPFARQGLTNGLLAAGLMSLLGLFAIGSGINPMVILLESGSVVLVGIALVLPLRRVHDRIRNAKAEELARCDAALERVRRQAIENGPDAGAGRLADLHAYRALVREVPEWPVDTPAVTRSALYLLIPVGSWIASAVVQYMVDRAMAP